MSDPREMASRATPKVTPERKQAWRQWVDDYISSCIAGWIEQGASRNEATECAAHVLAEFESIDDQPWMPLGEALMIRSGSVLMHSADKPIEGDTRVAYVRALRTAETSTESERTLATAYLMGWSVNHTASLRDKAKAFHDRETRGLGRTALYRYRDAANVLLYVGITKAPEKRAEQHRDRSNWWRFVDSTDLEWFASRGEAECAERTVIGTERPVFNQTHNKANREAVTEYLFAALDGASA